MLDAIVALQGALNQLANAEGRLAGIPDWMQELHTEHGLQQTEIETARLASDQAAHERRQAEAALTDAQEKLKRYQEQLSRVSTQREYGALLKEIDGVKALIRTTEQQALEALERYEKAQQALVEHTSGFQELDLRYRTELAKWEAEKPAIAQLAAELKTQVDELRQRLPAGTRILFERIYERTGGDAIARVVRIEGAAGRGSSANTLWHCNACSYSVRPQIVVEIRDGSKLNQCESCKRILFWQAE